jgi:serine/threonine-protein kinase
MPLTCPRCYAIYHQTVKFCGLCGAEIPPTTDTIESFPDPLIGQVVSDRYRLTGLIGRGGMGAVYKAEHVALGKPLAVKILHGTLGQRKEVLQRFRREAEAASKLMHIHTVQVFDYGHWRGLTYLVMEHLRGADLSSVIRTDGRLPWPRALSIVAQVCDSLSEAHAMGIVHRDLKPENILLVPRAGHPDFVKVVDFGLAKVRDEKGQATLDTTGDGSLLGTPFYMAPEQIRGEPVDARTDIYAIGGVLYRCLTGLPPFEAPTPFAVLTKHLSDTLVPPSRRVEDAAIPPPVDAVVLKAMARDAAGRYRTADEMRQACTDLLAALAPSAATPAYVPAIPAATPTLQPPGAPPVPAPPVPAAPPTAASLPAFAIAPPAAAAPPPAASLPAFAIAPPAAAAPPPAASLPAFAIAPPAAAAPPAASLPAFAIAPPAAAAPPPAGSPSVPPVALDGLDLSRDEFDRYLRGLRWKRRIGWSFVGLLLAAGAAAAFVVPPLLEEPPGPLTEELELNNVPTAANRVLLETAVGGTIGRRVSPVEGDADWYRIEIRPLRKGVLHVDLTGIPGLDLRVDLFDASGGEPVATGNRGGLGAAEAIPGVLADGMVYFVRVSEALGTDAVPSERISDRYAVKVRHLPSEQWEGEPNDDPATALALAPGASLQGWLEVDYDRDRYCVPGTTGAAPKVVVTPPAGLDVALETGGQAFNAGGPGAPESATLAPTDPCVSVVLAPNAAPEGRAAVGPSEPYKLDVR